MYTGVQHHSSRNGHDGLDGTLGLPIVMMCTRSVVDEDTTADVHVLLLRLALRREQPALR